MVEAGGGREEGRPDLGRVADVDGTGRFTDQRGPRRVASTAYLEALEVRCQALRQAVGSAREPGAHPADAIGGLEEFRGPQEADCGDPAAAALVGPGGCPPRVDLRAGATR